MPNLKSFDGARYLGEGYQLVWKPRIRQYVLIPLLVNFVLLGVATLYAYSLISEWYNDLPHWINNMVNHEDWYISWPASGLEVLLNYLGWLVWPLIILSLLITVFYFFGLLANLIAAPFNGLLSEAVEKHLAREQGQIPNREFNDEFNSIEFIKDIPRLVLREIRKLIYYIPRALLIILLLVTPLSPFVPIIWFLFNAWMSALQYIDYPEDNHRFSFQHTLALVQKNRTGPFGFGLITMAFTMLPLVNILVMPVAVAGATKLWFEHYKES